MGFAGQDQHSTGSDRSVCNALHAIGNTGDAAMAAVAARLLDDPSPMAPGAAVLALGRLVADIERLRAAHLLTETDATVRDEWCHAQPTGVIPVSPQGEDRDP